MKVQSGFGGILISCNPSYVRLTGTPLGDPIELGAAAAVFLNAAPSPGSRAYPSPLSLMASKSWAGHAEPAAGIVGAVHAAVALRLSIDLPIMHLAQFSVHVAGVNAAAAGSGQQLSGDGMGSGSVVRASRQAAPRASVHPPGGRRWPQQLNRHGTVMGEAAAARADVAGVSAFAFQV